MIKNLIIKEKMFSFVLKFTLIAFIFTMYSCSKDEGEETCKVNVANSSVTVTSNVSGEEGTQISPDKIISSTITASSADVIFKVHKVGACHEIIDYGHTWSKDVATPTIDSEKSHRSGYGTHVNFGDEVRTSMKDLVANKKYYVRGYVIIKSENYNIKVLYNDNITVFKTLLECSEGEEVVLDDSDRKLITIKNENTGSPLLDFLIIREKKATCVNGALVEGNGWGNHYVEIKNKHNETLSFNYKINYNLDDTYVWSSEGSVSSLSPNKIIKKHLGANTYGNVRHANIEVYVNITN